MLIVEPRPGPSPTSVTAPLSERVEAVLVQRDREHVGVAPEGRLGAVAVVHVPVDDRDPPDAPRRAQVQHRERDVAEQAEAAAGRRARRDVPAAARGRRRSRRWPASTASAATMQPPAASRAISSPAGSERRAVPGVSAGSGTRLLEPRQIAGRVQPQDLLVGRPGAAASGTSERTRPLASSRFLKRRLVSGDSQCGYGSTSGGPGLHDARVMPEVALVEDEPDPSHPREPLARRSADPRVELLEAAVVHVDLVGERALLVLRHLVRLALRRARVARAARHPRAP